METKSNIEIHPEGPKIPKEVCILNAEGESGTVKVPTDRQAHLEEIGKLKQHRGPLYWVTFILSLVSLGILVVWMISSNRASPLAWVGLDIALSAFFAVEFFTRRGLRWNWVRYLWSRFFDFIAIVPALALIYFNVSYEAAWVWVIVAARAFHVIDRLLGDGFVRRNILALIEGFEEEITDRVMLRIIARVETDLARCSFSHGVAQSLENNKGSVLNRVKSAHPQDGLGANLARITGLDSALERAEERTFDAIVKIIDSPEVDQAIRDAIDSAFVTMKKEMEVKTWRDKVGIQRE